MGNKIRRTDMKLVEGVQSRMDAAAIKREFLLNLFTQQAKFLEVATHNDLYMALAHTVRDRMMHRFIRSSYTYFEEASRTVAYLSAEFLIGPQLGYNLLALGAMEEARKAMADLGISLDALLEHEEEPGLGNGGLGRLAACYMDSLATLQIPCIGYGIRYEFGIFDQQIRDGKQVEVPDRWLRYGYPWEVPRPDAEIQVKLGGRTEPGYDAHGRFVSRWIPGRVVNGVPCDTLALGYGVENTNFLRLWQAVAAEELDLNAFNVGDYVGAVEEKIHSENITKVLYPNDQPEAGKILRLEQEYFFVSCSLQDMIRIYLQREKDLTRFHEKYAIQLNDTHPAIAVAELMRLLVDEHFMAWDKAWHITTSCLGYTNHTLLPEALEVWNLPLFKRVLPRHLEIIFEINQRFLDDVRRRYPGDDVRLGRLSLIDEHGEKAVRMANLACVGSHAINGVAELHTELLKTTVLRDFYEMMPEKFSNKTNGVTPRRFVTLANPGLSSLLTEVAGPDWLRDYEKLRPALEPLATDSSFVERFRAVKRQNKVVLADIIRSRTGIVVNPDALFDVHVKRIHEYKRQHLNVLHVIALYRRIKEGRIKLDVPRVVIFGGKAAPGYFMAKLIIQLIHDVADFINRDPEVQGKLKVAFIPDFSVKLAQHIYPAADLSEQISTAGKEASGTGNMKFAMNGALTIGTLDGANVEIREEVGAENFFLFGLTAEEVTAKKHDYRPRELYESNPELKKVIDLIANGTFSHGDRTVFAPIVQSLLEWDTYFLLSDFASYVDTQEQVANTYATPEEYARMAILNVARVGKFSSDRSIADYCRDIWHVHPVDVTARDEQRKSHPTPVPPPVST